MSKCIISNMVPLWCSVDKPDLNTKVTLVPFFLTTYISYIHIWFIQSVLGIALSIKNISDRKAPRQNLNSIAQI